MASKISVKNFEVTTTVFKVDDPDIKKLLPTVNIPQSCSLELRGVNNAIANALRRAATSEIPISTLKFDTHNLTTNNPFILVDMIQNRIQLMPIRQNAAGKFALRAVNNTGALRDVYSREIVRTEGKAEQIFNETFVICTLEPGQYIIIENIRVDTGYAYQHACHTVAVHPTSIALNEEPYNEFTGEGISSSISNETAFKWSFDTNGTMSPSEIIHLTCDTLIARLRSVLSLLDNISISNDLYTLVIANESSTIGNLLMRNINHLYPDIIYCAFTPDSISRKMTLKLRTDDDPNVVISSAVKYSIDCITDIKSQIPHK
jgi:DNA-directed RNA polymerase subunit L